MADMDVTTQTQEEPHIPVVLVTIHVFGGADGVGAGIKTGPAPASKASIEAMPRMKVKGCGNDCSICLDEFKVDEEASEMPCKHVFHSGCVEKWLQIHGSCPVCRYLMPADEEAAESRGGDEEGREIGLGFLQSVVAVASLTALIGMADSDRESEQADAGQVEDVDDIEDVDDLDSSIQDMDCD